MCDFHGTVSSFQFFSTDIFTKNQPVAQCFIFSDLFLQCFIFCVLIWAQERIPDVKLNSPLSLGTVRLKKPCVIFNIRSINFGNKILNYAEKCSPFKIKPQQMVRPHELCKLGVFELSVCFPIRCKGFFEKETRLTGRTRNAQQRTKPPARPGLMLPTTAMCVDVGFTWTGQFNGEKWCQRRK